MYTYMHVYAFRARSITQGLERAVVGRCAPNNEERARAVILIASTELLSLRRISIYSSAYCYLLVNWVACYSGVRQRICH